MTVRTPLAGTSPPTPTSAKHPRLGAPPPSLHPPGHQASRAEVELGETPARRAAALAALSTALCADAAVSPTNATPATETALLLRALAADEPLLLAYARGAKFAPAPAVARLRELVAYVGRHPEVLAPPAAAIRAVCGADDGGAAALTLSPSTDRWGHPLVVVWMGKLLRLADGGQLDAAVSAPAPAGGGGGGCGSVSSRGGSGSDSGDSSTWSAVGASPITGGDSNGGFDDGDVGGAGPTRLLWVTLWCLLALLRQPRVSNVGWRSYKTWVAWASPPTAASAGATLPPPLACCITCCPVACEASMCSGSRPWSGWRGQWPAASWRARWPPDGQCMGNQAGRVARVRRTPAPPLPPPRGEGVARRAAAARLGRRPRVAASGAGGGARRHV